MKQRGKRKSSAGASASAGGSGSGSGSSGKGASAEAGASAGGRKGSSDAASLASGPRVGLGVACLVYFILSVVYFYPAFEPGKSIFGTDYLAAGYFFQQFESARFAAGHLPGWVPYLYGGLPFFANPGSAFFPFRFLADWLFPVSRILPTLFVIQFALAGIGMYLLTAELGVRSWIAGIAGLAFEFTGLTMSFVYAGQDGRIIGATFMPLVFFFLHRGIRTGRVGPFVGLAAVTGFSLLSFQIQTNYYLLLAALIFAIFSLIHLGYLGRPGELSRRAVLGVVAVLFGFAMASVNFLPFMRYVPQSPRGGPGRGYEYSTSFSMPPVETLGLAVPEQAGILDNYHGANPFKLHTEYAGVFAVGLFVLGLLYSRRNRYWWLFGGLALFALSLSYGGHTPIYHLYYDFLPGTKKFRAPSISFFLVSSSLVCMGGLTMERIAALVDERRSTSSRRGAKGDDPLRWATWSLSGVVALAVLGAILNSGSGEAAAQAGAVMGYVRFGFFLTLFTLFLWLWMSGRSPTTLTAVLLAIVTVVDLWIIDRKFFKTIPPPDAIFRPDDVVSFLQSQQGGRFRVWVLPFPAGSTYRQDDYLMHFDIDQAGGEHSDPVQRYDEFLGAGTKTMVDWHNFLQYPVFMDADNVRFLIAGVGLKIPGFKEVHRGQYAIIYENEQAMPRAYLVPDVQVVKPPDGAITAMHSDAFDPTQTALLYAPPPQPLPSGPLQGSATIARYQPDHVEVRTQANREAMLVLADTYYSDWVAAVDGHTAPMLRVNHAFRGVEVPAGPHDVTFDFRPASLYIGFRIYLACLALLALYGIFAGIALWRRRRAPSPA